MFLGFRESLLHKVSMFLLGDKSQNSSEGGVLIRLPNYTEFPSTAHLHLVITSN